MLASILLMSLSISAQGEGGVFTSQRFASIKTGEGSLGNNPSALNWFNDLRNKTAKLGTEKNISLADIQGTVYKNEAFKKGHIYYRYTPYGEFLMRYDAFNDELELKRTDETGIEALHKNEAISCVLDNEEYHYTSFVSVSGAVTKGYLVALFKGTTYTLYIRSVKLFKEAKPAKTSLATSFPHRFVDDVSFYIQEEHAMPTYIKPSKKEMMRRFPNQKNALKQFFKEHSITLKEKSDFVRTLQFLDGR